METERQQVTNIYTKNIVHISGYKIIGEGNQNFEENNLLKFKKNFYS